MEEDGAGADPDSIHEAQTILNMDATSREMTVFVSDIRGFTSMSKKISDDALAVVLGAWFREVNEVVESNGGVIDKFIGDAVMAIWLKGKGGTSDTVYSALRTALELNRAMGEINDRFPDLPAPLRIGVGINTGRAFMGNVGVAGTRDYTALGDTVNVAFHLESSTKTLDTDVVLSDKSYKHLPDGSFEKYLRSAEIKGGDEAVTVCAMSFAQLGEIPDLEK
jgi:adenylate cyclase